MVRVRFFVRNDNPNTIWNCLAGRLGREPTNDEARTEVLRILGETCTERPDMISRTHKAGIEAREIAALPALQMEKGR